MVSEDIYKKEFSNKKEFRAQRLGVAATAAAAASISIIVGPPLLEFFHKIEFLGLGSLYAKFRGFGDLLPPLLQRR